MEGKIDLRDEVSRDKKNWSFLLSHPEVVPLQMRDPQAFANAEITDDLDPGRKGSLWLPFILVSLLTASGIIASVFFQESDSSNLPDCAAEPAPGINWNSCNKRNLQAENSNLDNLMATNVIMNSIKLTGSSLRSANLNYAQLENADLAYVDFSAASLKGANLHGADLSNAILNDADLRYADLTEAHLGGLQLHNAQFDGAIWNNGKPCKAGSVGKCVQ